MKRYSIAYSRTLDTCCFSKPTELYVSAKHMLTYNRRLPQIDDIFKIALYTVIP